MEPVTTTSTLFLCRSVASAILLFALLSYLVSRLVRGRTFTPAPPSPPRHHSSTAPCSAESVISTLSWAQLFGDPSKPAIVSLSALAYSEDATRKPTNPFQRSGKQQISTDQWFSEHNKRSSRGTDLFPEDDYVCEWSANPHLTRRHTPPHILDPNRLTGILWAGMALFDYATPGASASPTWAPLRTADGTLITPRRCRGRKDRRAKKRREREQLEADKIRFGGRTREEFLADLRWK